MSNRLLTWSQSIFGNYKPVTYTETRLLETDCDEQLSIIDDFGSDILMMTSTTILIPKSNGPNYNQLSREMALRLKQKQVYGIATGKDEQPESLPENATAAEKLTHWAAVKDRV